MLRRRLDRADKSRVLMRRVVGVGAAPALRMFEAGRQRFGIHREHEVRAGDAEAADGEPRRAGVIVAGLEDGAIVLDAGARGGRRAASFDAHGRLTDGVLGPRCADCGERRDRP